MAVGRGFQGPKFEFQSQFVPLPLDFMQKQIESRQKRQDEVLKQVDDLGTLVSAIDPRVQDINYAKQIQQEYNKLLEPYATGEDLTSSATISAIRSIKNKFAQDERLKVLAHNKEQQKLYDKLQSEGKLTGALLPNKQEFSYDTDNIEGKSVDLGKLLYYQDWQTPITNQLKLVEDEIVKNTPGAKIKTIQDEEGNWVRVLEKPGSTTIKLKDHDTFKAAVDSIATEALQGSTPYSIYMNEFAKSKNKNPKEEIRNMVERLSIPMYKKEETGTEGSMQVITSSDELAKEARTAKTKTKEESEVVNPNYAPVTSAYDVKTLNKIYVNKNEVLKKWDEFKQDADNVDMAFYKVNDGDSEPLKTILYDGISDKDKVYLSMNDVQHGVDPNNNYIPNVNLTKETLAKNKLINENKAKEGTDQYKKNYVPSTQEIIAEANEISDEDLFNIDNKIDANINAINNYRKVTNNVLRNAKNEVSKNLEENELLALNPERNKEAYRTAKQYAYARALRELGIDNKDNFIIKDKDGNNVNIYKKYQKEHDGLLNIIQRAPATNKFYIPSPVLERTERFLANLEKETKGKVNVRQPFVDLELGFNRKDYEEALQEEAAKQFESAKEERVPVITWSREGQTRKENQDNTLIDFENKLRDDVGYKEETVDGEKVYRPKNLQALSTLDNVTVVDNSLDPNLNLGQEIKGDKFYPTEEGVFGTSEKYKDEYYVGIQYQGVANIGNQWRTVGNLVKADGTVGALVAFRRQGEDTNTEVYKGLGIGDVSSVINTVDYIIDNSKEANKGTSTNIVPGVTLDFSRKPVLGSPEKTTYRVNYDFNPEKVNKLENQLRAKKIYTEDQIQGIIKNVTNPKKEFSNKIEMGLELQNLIQIFSDPSLGK